MSIEFSDLQKRLEAERWDITYRTGKPVTFDAVREKRFYDAGRYAAGARDAVAFAADKWLQKELAYEA
jgi:hypothetical protein